MDAIEEKRRIELRDKLLDLANRLGFASNAILQIKDELAEQVKIICDVEEDGENKEFKEGVVRILEEIRKENDDKPRRGGLIIPHRFQ